METYLTTMFVLGVIIVIGRSIRLGGHHPRAQVFTAGQDLLKWFVAVGMLTWVFYLKFYS